MHTSETIGLYSTIVTREDYDVMAAQLIDSIKADTPSNDDFPEHPVFTNINNSDWNDDTEDDLPPHSRANQGALPHHSIHIAHIRSKICPNQYYLTTIFSEWRIIPFVFDLLQCMLRLIITLELHNINIFISL